MFWRKGSSFLQTTTFRLTLWYLVVFSALSVAVFLVVYISLALRLQNETDQEIMDKSKEFAELYRDHGVSALQAEFRREAQSQGTRQAFFRLLLPDGKVLATSDVSPWAGLGTLHSRADDARRNGPSYRTLSLPGRRYKVRLLSMPANDKHVIEIGRSLKAPELILEKYRETFGTAMAVMLVCGGLFGFLLARKAMAGVQRVTETATRIGRQEDLGRRVPPAHEGHEINALANAFNAMLERIESLLNELQEITDNIAHELRTPITRIRGIAETTLRSATHINEFQEMSATVIDQCDDLIEMIATMLEIAKADSGVAEFDIAPLDFCEIAAEAVDLFAPMAEDKGVELQLINPFHSMAGSGDRKRLQRAVANLLDNAVKYTPPGGRVTLSVLEDAAGVHVKISDTGMGIDENDLPHIFERFYRGDKSRSTAGSGLGLSLARAIVWAHGGQITVKNALQGAVFHILLPNESSPHRARP
jgi:heavy metal sensor kinase